MISARMKSVQQRYNASGSASVQHPNLFRYFILTVELLRSSCLESKNYGLSAAPAGTMRDHALTKTSLSPFRLVLRRGPRFHGESVDFLHIVSDHLIYHPLPLQQWDGVKLFRHDDTFKFGTTAITRVDHLHNTWLDAGRRKLGPQVLCVNRHAVDAAGTCTRETVSMHVSSTAALATPGACDSVTALTAARSSRCAVGQDKAAPTPQ